MFFQKYHLPSLVVAKTLISRPVICVVRTETEDSRHSVLAEIFSFPVSIVAKRVTHLFTGPKGK